MICRESFTSFQFYASVYFLLSGCTDNISNQVLNKGGDNGHFCSVLIFSVKSVIVFLLS